MVANKSSGDPGKFYSLFGGPESYQTYGPGQADYITVPGPNQVGPLINIPLLMKEMGKPGASRGEIENIFGKPLKTKQPLPPKGRATAEADTGTRTDAMEIRAKEKPAVKKPAPAQRDPASSTPSVQNSKGDMTPPPTDPFSEMIEALMGMFTGGTPSPGMGGGTTVAPQGGSPFIQMPTTMDVPEQNPFLNSGPDESILANLIRGPQAMAADQTQEMTSLPPMMQQAQRAQQAAAQPPAVPNNPQIPPTPQTRSLRPPMPAQNPLFHGNPDQSFGAGGEIGGQNDLRTIGMMLNEMFGGQGAAPAMPTRNSLFSGGV